MQGILPIPCQYANAPEGGGVSAARIREWGRGQRRADMRGMEGHGHAWCWKW